MAPRRRPPPAACSRGASTSSGAPTPTSPRSWTASRLPDFDLVVVACSGDADAGHRVCRTVRAAVSDSARPAHLQPARGRRAAGLRPGLRRLHHHRGRPRRSSGPGSRPSPPAAARGAVRPRRRVRPGRRRPVTTGRERARDPHRADPHRVRPPARDDDPAASGHPPSRAARGGLGRLPTERPRSRRAPEPAASQGAPGRAAPRSGSPCRGSATGSGPRPTPDHAGRDTTDHHGDRHGPPPAPGSPRPSARGTTRRPGLTPRYGHRFGGSGVRGLPS